MISLYSNPAFSQSNEAVLYYNKAVGNHRNKQYALATENYQKAISLYPKFADAYYNLAICYSHLGKQDLAIRNYKKVLELNPKESSARGNLISIYYNRAIDLKDSNSYISAISELDNAALLDSENHDIYSLRAFCCLKAGLYDKAREDYKKVLKLDNTNEEAINNLKVLNNLENEQRMTEKLNSLVITQQAPQELYSLVKVKSGISPDIYGKTYQILDLLWGDREGQNLLRAIIKNRIPLVITYSGANTEAQIKSNKMYLSYFGIPLVPIYTPRGKEISVIISDEFVYKFLNSDLRTSKRIEALQVFVHEFCHAAKNTVTASSDNSILEELTSSIIGYNIASRLIDGRDLTEEETYDYSRRCLKAILTDKHKVLPLYNNFNNDIQKLGVYPPYFHRYQNILELYKDVRNDSDTIRYTKFESMISR